MEKKEQYEAFEMNLCDVIALCNILDEFEEFDDNVTKFLNDNSNWYGKLQALRKLSCDDKFIFDHDVRKFYKDNKEVINEINKHTTISSFILYNWPNKKDREKILKMYNYLLKNRDKMDNILAVLNRLEGLGFSHFQFCENMSFDEQVYRYHKSVISSDFYYLDGDVLLQPSYDANAFVYKSIGANYLIDINVSCNKVSKYGHKITLNNLVFDVNLLPSEITYEETIGKIVDLKEKNKGTDDVIRNSILLDDNLNDLIPIVNRIDNIIKCLKDSEDQERALEIISETRGNIFELAGLLLKYENDNIEKQLVSKEMLDKEKKLYERRKYLARIDAC